jgi:hypothetical protein
MLLVALFISLIAIAPVMGAMTLSGVKYMADVTPGTTVTFPMMLSTAPSDAAADYEITVLGFGNAPNGNYLGIDPIQDTGPYTARPFITLDKTTVHITPGGKEVVTATINVPASGNGGRYALINIHPKQVTSAGTGPSITTAINVPVMITLIGTQITETGTIESISADNAVTGQPFTITTVFTNTGNHHYYNTRNEIVVTDSSKKEVARASTDPSITAIVPGGKVNFTQQITTSMSPDTYTVTSQVFSVNGTVLATKTASFTVSTPSAVQTPTTSNTKAPGTIAPSGVTVTPESKTTTKSPLSIPIIVLALTVIVSISGMRRRS